MSVTPDADVTPEIDFTTDSAVASVATDDGPTPDAGAAACPNCGSLRLGKYCSICGQKAAPSAPTVGYFVHELTHELLHVDGKIFRSLRLLLTRPGFLTREIFRGRRARYISPIRLYLTASILAFALGAFGGFDSLNVEYTPSAGESAAPEQVEIAEGAESTIARALRVWLPRAMFVLVPLFAALVMLFRRGSGHTYPQHLYFAFHVHAAWFFANAVDSLFEAVPPLRFAGPVADILTEIYILVYFFVAFRSAYETTVWDTLGRTVSIGLIYGAALIATVAAIAAPIMWPLLFGRSL
jgi:hypothetical protein